MESKELEEVVLPVQLLEMIALEADEVTKEKSKGGSKDFALGFQHGYFIGATEWAQWKVKYDELNVKAKIQEAAIELLAEKHLKLKERCDKMEAALKKVKGKLNWIENSEEIAMINEALKEGENNTPAPVQGEIKEINMSYTKGQWYLQKYTDAYTNIIRCNNGKGHETLFIASTPQSSMPEARANAKLMAAALDLLEALQEVVRISDRNHVAWIKAKAAIEKAIGNDIIETQ